MSTKVDAVRVSGWAAFAGTVLVIVGAVNVIYGLTAVFKDEVVTAAGGRVIVWDLTAMGWILIVFGIIQLLAGSALFAGAGWARWTAVVLAGLNAIANVGFFTVNPLWTMLIVGLNVIVIYQLTAGWAPEAYTYETYSGRDVGPTGARDEMTRHRTGL
jgi:hypothetical protein